MQLTSRIRIRKVLGEHLGPETSNPDQDFSGFPQSMEIQEQYL
jgi:hypothetical protein